MTDRRSRASPLLCLVPIMLLAAGVRILGLGNTDLWGDEAFSVMASLGPVNHLLSMLSTGEPHPPLYPFLLVGWLRAFGHSEFVARLPSAFAGIASVPVVAVLAKSFVEELGDGRAVQASPAAVLPTRPLAAMAAPVIAGLLVALNPIQVWYSQEARMYAQVSFFAGLATLALLRLWHGRRGSTPLYVLAILGAAGSHYYGLFIPLAHGIAVLLFARRRRDVFVRWLRAALVAAVLYLPWVVIALNVFTSYYGAQPGTVDLWGVALSAWVRIAAGWSLSWTHALVAAAVVTALVAVGLGSRARSETEQFSRVVLASWLLTPFVAGFVISLIRPLYAERYLVVSSLPFALLMTRGIVGIGGWRGAAETWGRGAAAPRGRLDHEDRETMRKDHEKSSVGAQRSRVRRGAPVSPTTTGSQSGLRIASTERPGSPRRIDRATFALADLFRDLFAPFRDLRGPNANVARARPSLATLALLGALAVAMVPLYNEWTGRYLKSAYNTHMQMVEALARPDDAVILDGTSQLPLYMYYLRKPFPTYPLPSHLPLDRTATVQDLTNIAQGHSGAWIFLYATPDYDPSYFIPRWLTTHAYRAFDIWEVNGRLQYYRFATTQDLTSHPTQIKFGQSLLLQGYGWQDDAAPAGDSIPIDLDWRWLAAKLSQPAVALRLVDDAGLTWAQTDQAIGGGYLPSGAWPTGQALDDRHGLMIPPGTPPGTYHLILNVYSADHPEPLTPTGGGAAISPGGVELATIHVGAPSQSIWPGGIAGYQTVTASFGDSIALLGYAGSDTVKAGESGYLTLVWKALTGHPAITGLRLELIGPDGKVAEQRDVPLATTSYPPVQWSVGDVLREQYHLPIGARLSPGDYRLAVEPLGQSASPAILGSLKVEPGLAPVATSPPQHALDDRLGGSIALTGFDLGSTRVQPGATVGLTLHWQDVAALDGDYTVFVHVLDAKEKVVVQRDQAPANGSRPTSSWFPGDIVLDKYALPLPHDLAPGAYPIEVGMYNPTDGKRLPVSLDGKPAGDHIVVATLTVGS